MERKYGDERDWPTWTITEFGMAAPGASFVGQPVNIPIRPNEQLFVSIGVGGEMKAKRKSKQITRRLTPKQRETVRQTELTEANASGYNSGYRDGTTVGRRDEAATYEGRRFDMAERLVMTATRLVEASLCPGGNLANVSPTVDALAHMMPYRNGNNQRP